MTSTPSLTSKVGTDLAGGLMNCVKDTDSRELQRFIYNLLLWKVRPTNIVRKPQQSPIIAHMIWESTPDLFWDFQDTDRFSPKPLGRILDCCRSKYY